MKKFVLTCNIERLVLSDFDVVLQQGDEIELTEREVSSSPNLLMALRHGGLTMKKKAHPKVRSTSSRIRPKRKVRKIKKTKTPTMEDRLKLMISETLEQKLSKILRAVENQPVENPQQTVEIDTFAVMEAVKEALSGIQTVAHVGHSTTSSSNIPIDDTPMFIPTGIVESDLSGDIDTEQESSKGSSVDAATEALRLLRKAKKK